MFHIRTHCRRVAVAAVCLLVAAALPASAATILLEVDVGDPNEVTLTSTGERSLIDDDSARIGDGITLKGFFASDFDADVVAFQGVYTQGPEPLIPAGAGTNYNAFDNGFTGVGLRDVNLYQQGSGRGPRQRFKKTQAAFTGEGYLTFEDFFGDGFTPPEFTNGFIGDILVGYGNNGSGRVVGQFQIVGGTPIPEPVAALGGMTLLGTIVLRRRRAAV